MKLRFATFILCIPSALAAQDAAVLHDLEAGSSNEATERPIIEANIDEDLNLVACNSSISLRETPTLEERGNFLFGVRFCDKIFASHLTTDRASDIPVPILQIQEMAPPGVGGSINPTNDPTGHAPPGIGGPVTPPTPPSPPPEAPPTNPPESGPTITLTPSSTTMPQSQWTGEELGRLMSIQQLLEANGISVEEIEGNER